MSLSGLLPPMNDNGRLLVDGGYVNNLPVDVMRSLGADTIIAIDVGSEDDTSLIHYGDSLSGWRVLFERWNPFRTGPRPLSLTEIQYRLAYVSSVKQLEEAKAMEKAMYVRPPVSVFGTLEFGNFDRIFQTGYLHGQQIIAEWEEEGIFMKWRNLANEGRKKRARRARRNSI